MLNANATAHKGANIWSIMFIFLYISQSATFYSMTVTLILKYGISIVDQCFASLNHEMFTDLLCMNIVPRALKYIAELSECILSATQTT